RHRPAGDETVPHPSDVFVLVRWVGVRRTHPFFVVPAFLFLSSLLGGELRDLLQIAQSGQ
ncbi:MAG: hypothetical protein WBE74_04280, partial [Terracidiphilus sp.]